MLTNEQLRTLENLAVAYDEWLAAERVVPEGRPWLHWKTVSGKDYLYEKRGPRGATPSLGPRSAETERVYKEYRQRMDRREKALARAKAIEEKLGEHARIYRSLKLPMLHATAGAVLRAADVRGLLGPAVMVVGTNTMAVYEVEAQERFATGLDATEDFDLTWAAERKTALAVAGDTRTPLLDLLKDVDDSFTVNSERTFQARNSSAYEVDVLCAPSLKETYPPSEQIRPTYLPEQEWLLLGKPVSQVLCDRSNMAVRIVAPDPRWMALHKLWLADKPGRNRKKAGKDRAQGEALMGAIAAHMPHYKFDAAFRAKVPADLKGYLPRG